VGHHLTPLPSGRNRNILTPVTVSDIYAISSDRGWFQAAFPDSAVPEILFLYARKLD